MKKLISTTAVLLLFVSCTVTKQNSSDYSSSLQGRKGYNQTGQVTHTSENKNIKTKKNTVSSTTVSAQEKADYNPYRYEERKTVQEQINAEEYQKFLVEECDTLELQTWIEHYNTTKVTQFLWDILYYNCSEGIDYAIDLINTSPDEDARKVAISSLGFKRHYDAIPLLLSHVKKEISSDEKIIVGSTLALLDKKVEALEILNCNCYGRDDMNDDCIYTYFHSFDKATAIKYFEHYFNKPETQLEAASWLATCGIYDKTFPLFVKFLETNTKYERATVYSLVGLATIGTDEAFDIIKQKANNSTGLIARTATQILDERMKERSKK